MSFKTNTCDCSSIVSLEVDDLAPIIAPDISRSFESNSSDGNPRGDVNSAIFTDVGGSERISSTGADSFV